MHITWGQRAALALVLSLAQNSLVHLVLKVSCTCFSELGQSNVHTYLRSYANLVHFMSSLSLTHLYFSLKLALLIIWNFFQYLLILFFLFLFLFLFIRFSALWLVENFSSIFRWNKAILCPAYDCGKTQHQRIGISLMTSLKFKRIELRK